MTLPYRIWPADDLVPAHITPRQVSFTRDGGFSLGGVSRPIRTDRGFWRIEMTGIPVGGRAQRQIFNRVRTDLNGPAGLVVVPALTWDSSPFASGEVE